MPTQINNRPLRYERHSRLFAHDARHAQTHYKVHAGDIFVSLDNREYVIETASFRSPTVFHTNKPQRTQLFVHSDTARQIGLAAIERKTVIDDDTRHALAIRSLLEFTKYSQPNPTRAINCLLLRQEPEAILALARHPILTPFHLVGMH